tara:strand:- start:3010 stop:3729 length:720 start_codon:yes stop_codon:yes gene_type:complete
LIFKGKLIQKDNKNKMNRTRRSAANIKRIRSCKKVGGSCKREGHRKEAVFNQLYNPSCSDITMKAEADCEIVVGHPILKTLVEKGIIDSTDKRNTSNKSGKSIQFTLGNIPELEDSKKNLEIMQNTLECKMILNKYLKKINSNRPADLMVYDSEKSHIFFNMDQTIDFICRNATFRKIEETGRIKGDFNDKSSRTGKRALLTYEKRNKKGYFLGFSGGQGKLFINLLKDNINFHEQSHE